MVLLCILISNLEWKALLPMGVLCLVLYFFPRIVLSLLGTFVAWMLYPLVPTRRLEPLTSQPGLPADPLCSSPWLAC